MKIRCKRAKFWEAFQTVASVVPARSPKPILQNVKLEVTNDGTLLTATDLEVGIRCSVPDVEVQAVGSTLLPAQRFSGILRESPDEEIEISATADANEIVGERSRFKLPAEDASEFPSVASFSEEKYHEVPARFLKEVIRRTVFATDTESSRYALGGVLFELDEEKLSAVGTDGRRLAKMDGPAISVNGHQTGGQTTIVPSRALQLIDRALTDADAEIKLSAQANSVMVQSPRVTVYSQLVEGRYPKWRDVFPSGDNQIRIELPVSTFYSAVRQAAIVTNEESRGIEFSFGEGTALLTAEGGQTGQSRIELPIAYTGETISIMLDPKYMSDFLKVLDSETTFTFELRDSKSAALCFTEDGYSYIIMPMARDR